MWMGCAWRQSSNPKVEGDKPDGFLETIRFKDGGVQRLRVGVSGRRELSNIT